MSASGFHWFRCWLVIVVGFAGLNLAVGLFGLAGWPVLACDFIWVGLQICIVARYSVYLSQLPC